MNNERRRLNNMMNYFGWKPKDLARISGYSIHNVYTNQTRYISPELMEAVSFWENLTDYGKEFLDYGIVKEIKPAKKGWHNVSFYLLCVQKRCKNRSFLLKQ